MVMRSWKQIWKKRWEKSAVRGMRDGERKKEEEEAVVKGVCFIEIFKPGAGQAIVPAFDGTQWKHSEVAQLHFVLTAGEECSK